MFHETTTVFLLPQISLLHVRQFCVADVFVITKCIVLIYRTFGQSGRQLFYVPLGLTQNNGTQLRNKTQCTCQLKKIVCCPCNWAILRLCITLLALWLAVSFCSEKFAWNFYSPCLRVKPTYFIQFRWSNLSCYGTMPDVNTCNTVTIPVEFWCFLLTTRQ